MESKMLAEVKPEIKTEAREAEKDLLDKQLKPFEERLQSRRVLLFPSTQTPNENQGSRGSQSIDDHDSVVNFGWEQIEEGPLLPFVKRGTENFVANHIVAEQVYKPIRMVFSDAMLCCMAILMERMSKEEADTFNDININHCDRSIVGSYCFKSGQFMIKLEYVKKVVEFFQACQKLIISKEKENSLFGFIRIAGENQVPFVWNGNRKLVPLFYFDGQSEYLEARSEILTDPWQIGYLKFCCKVQKVRNDFYEQRPIKVVDAEDVKRLFRADTIFEVYLPESVNPNILAPEVRVAALHETEKNLQMHQNSPVEENNNISHPTSNNGVSNIINRYDTVSQSTTSIRGTFAPQEPENANSKNEKQQETGRKRKAVQNNHKTSEMQHGNEVPEPVQKRTAQSFSENEAKRPRIEAIHPLKTNLCGAMLPEQSTKNNTSELATRTTLPQPHEIHTTNQSQSPQQTIDVQSLQSQNVLRTSRDLTITPINPEASSGQQINHETFRNFQVAAITAVPPPSQTYPKVYQDVCTKRPISNCHITNVPHTSPRSASSPGLRQPSLFMNEATQRDPGYRESTIVPAVVSTMTDKSVPQETISASVHFQPTLNMSQRQVGNNNNEQVNGANKKQNSFNAHYNANARPNFMPYIAQNMSIGAQSTTCGPTQCHYSTKQMAHSQVGPYPHAPNNCSTQVPCYFTGANQTAAAILRQTYLNQSINSNESRFQGPKHGQTSIPNSQLLFKIVNYPINQNIQQREFYIQNGCVQYPLNNLNQNSQNNLVSVPMGHQRIPGPMPSLSRQQYASPNASLVENFNVILSQSHVQQSATPRTSNMPSYGGEINNNIRNNNGELTVTEHPPGIVENPEFYTTNECAVKGKTLLRIRKSPMVNTFLVNLSEFVEKVLGLNPFTHQKQLAAKFKCLYELNHVQKVQWNRVIQEKQLEFVGPFKDVFVEYSELAR